MESTKEKEWTHLFLSTSSQCKQDLKDPLQRYLPDSGDDSCWVIALYRVWIQD